MTGIDSLAAYLVLDPKVHSVCTGNSAAEANEAPSFDLRRVLATLRNRLPLYMVPSLFVELSAEELGDVQRRSGASGKLNRKLLPAVGGLPALPLGGGHSEATDDHLTEDEKQLWSCTELQLCDIWESMLQREVHSRDSCFLLIWVATP
jgi:hypothetical protein